MTLLTSSVHGHFGFFLLKAAEYFFVKINMKKITFFKII